MWSRLRAWWLGQWHKVLAQPGSERSLARGFAVGLFWGFSPFWGLKTLLGLATAWIFRGNFVACLVGLTLHDIYLPLLPLVLEAQYLLGCLCLQRQPIGFEAVIKLVQSGPQAWLSWSTFTNLGQPLLLGAFAMGLLGAIVGYFCMLGLVHKLRSPKTSSPLDH
jgi:uncharacterized protein